MSSESAVCPYCGEPISPRPRRARACPHCQQRVIVRQGQLLPGEESRSDAMGNILPSPAMKSADRVVPREELRALLHELLQEMRKAEEPADRLATFRVFRSPLTTWESLFARAAQFVSKVGPRRLINLSHSEDNNEAVVTVWYWTDSEWKGIGEEEEEE